MSGISTVKHFLLVPCQDQYGLKYSFFKIKGSRNHKKFMNIGLKKRNQHHRVHILVNNKGLLSFFQKKLLLFEFELPMSILYLKHGS